MPEIVAAINARRPDVVGFSCYIWNFDLITQITPQLDCTIVLGGPQVTDIEAEILRTTRKSTSSSPARGRKPSSNCWSISPAASASRRSPASPRQPCTTRRAQLPDLDTIPPVFAEVFARHPKLTWVSFETSRGCPMGCGYCTWGFSRKMRYYPLDLVLTELDAILGNPNIREIYLCDSSLLLNKPRAKAILDHIIRSGHRGKAIRYEFTPEQLDDEIIERMLKLPTNEFNFGIQTINPPALTAIGRPFDRERFETSYRRFVAAFPSAQITVDLIYGLPNDNLAGYLDSLNYVMALPGVSRILTNPLIVLPGSRFFRDRENYGIVLADDGSFLLRENRTFTVAQMREARRISFHVNLLYLNTALRDALLRLAVETRTRPASA